MPRARSSAPILAVALGALALVPVGCGSSSPSASTGNEVAAGERASAAARRAAEARAPKGASAALRAIYAQFPPPRPSPEAKRRSAAAIRAGERACAGKTPLQVKEALYGAAKAKLTSEQAKMIARIGGYERHSASDQSFVSGQLGADVYAATLPAAVGRYGYQGCVYELAKGLERRLAPKG